MHVQVHTPTKEEDATKGGDAQEADQDNKQGAHLSPLHEGHEEMLQIS